MTIKTGDEFDTKNNGRLRIVEYRGCHEVDVEFISTGYRTTAHAHCIRDGNVFDKLRPSVYGVGFTGVGEYAATVGGISTKQYTTWQGMIKRCYSDDYQLKQQTYVGCLVCYEWHNFQTFAKWFDEHYVDGFQLDKDLLLKGNKIYSPSTCVFVIHSLNKLFTDRGNDRGNLPLGVTKHGSGFRTQINKAIGKVEKTFRTVEEAVEFYKHHKTKEIRRQAYLLTTPAVLVQPLLDRADTLEYT